MGRGVKGGTFDLDCSRPAVADLAFQAMEATGCVGEAICKSVLLIVKLKQRKLGRAPSPSDRPGLTTPRHAIKRQASVQAS